MPLALLVAITVLAFASNGWAQHQPEVLTLSSTRRDAEVVQVGKRELPRTLAAERPDMLDVYPELSDEDRLATDEPSAWVRYRLLILGTTAVLIAQAIVIAVLLVDRRRRRVVEHHLLQSETALRASYERIRGLGARLLHAQEAERSRIARELHDDVNQQLVLLAMELERVGATDARERAQTIARTVHDLSYRLHPEKLRLLGLTAALRGLERELSNEETEIVFTHDEVSSKLPANLTVSVYRLAQEALHNAVTHGRARRVFVDLRRSPAEVVLTIADDGVGFDVDAAWGRGLGLVSMRERVHAMGGTFTIDSQPGTGSRVAVTLPLEPVAAPAAT